MAISWRLAALLALGALPVIMVPIVTGGAVSPTATMLAWIALVLSLAALDIAVAGSPRAVRIKRELPDRVRLGEPATATLLLTNHGSRSIRALVRDGWEPSAGAQPSRHRLVVPAGERRAVTMTLTPFRRGERRSHHVTVRSFGPLGIAARQATLAEPAAIRVLPPFASRRHLPSRLARLRELDGRTSIMIRGQGSEFDSLRDYVRGDDVRSIDWRATARRRDPATGTGQRVVVRTWRPERDRRIVIVIDSGRTSAARIDNELRIDTAFESSLLLAALASRAGDRIDTVIYDRRVRARVQGTTGSELLARMVTAMAPVDPELIEMDWTAVPALVTSVTNRQALVVLMTSIDSPGNSRALLGVLPQLTQRHRVLVCSVTDPTVKEASRERQDRDSVFRAAAAERAMLDTARVSAAIRRLGGDVVTGTPQELPPAVADRYLALKAAGRL
ncbi:DUF58 domain-containing protein [Salinibacterium sp. GXW1014]|uniref:DUF58 domain-containing protein n=1 Tax=Salinibacterium sp. GXW1014 TaxID=3377838 RepID=UPI003839D928